MNEQDILNMRKGLNIDKKTLLIIYNQYKTDFQLNEIETRLRQQRIRNRNCPVEIFEEFDEEAFINDFYKKFELELWRKRQITLENAMFFGKY